MSLTFSGTGAGISAPEQLDYLNYHPMGSPLPKMTYYSNQLNNRFGYQGQFAEKDGETNENFFVRRGE